MKNLKFLSIFLSALMASFFANNVVFGQGTCTNLPTITGVVVTVGGANVPIQAANPGSNAPFQFVCINQTASSPEYTATVNVGTCTGTFNVTAAAAGQVTITAQPTGTGATRTFRFRSVNGSFCKGRITVSVSYLPTSVTTQPCTTNCGSCGPPVVSPTGFIPGSTINIPAQTYSVVLDVYKNITAYDPLVGPNCAGDRFVTFSVNPALQCPTDGIGVDNINWSTTALTNAGAVLRWGTTVNNPNSLTYDLLNFNPPAGGAAISATVGRCPSPFNVGTILLGRGASQSWITQSGPVNNLNGQPSSGLNTGIVGSVSPACGSVSIANGARENYIILPINTNATTTQQSVTLASNGINNGLNTTWALTPDLTANSVVPFTFTTVGSGPGTTLTFSTNNNPLNGAYNNGTGTFTLTASSPNCGGNTISSYRVLRSLVQAPSQIDPFVTGPASSRFNYITSGTAPRTCWQTGSANSQVLTLQNAPTGPFARFRWEAPAGWTLQVNNPANVPVASNITSPSSNVLIGTNLISVSMFPNSTGATPTNNGKLRVRVVQPGYENNPAVELCGNTYPLATVEYPIGSSNLVLANNSGGVAVTLNDIGFATGAGTGQLQAVLTGLGNTAVAPAPSNACTQAQFTFQYEFRGRVVNGSTTIYDSPDWGCVQSNTGTPPISLFQANTTICGINTVAPVNIMNAVTPMTYSASTVGGQLPQYRVTARSSTCVKNTCFEARAEYSVPLTGSTPPGTWRMAVDGEGDDFIIAPNPPINGVTKLMFKKASKGRVDVFDQAGKNISVTFINGSELEIDTKSLSKGFYVIRFSGENTSSSKKLIIQ